MIPNLKTERLMVTVNNATFQKVGRSNSIRSKKAQPSLTLNLSELVVNKNPDVPLKVGLTQKETKHFEAKKQQNLGKMSNVMNKLDGLADQEKVRFE